MSCNVDFHVISTGSCGNAVVINNEILIDCGIPFRDLENYYSKLKLVCLTHIHGDHFNVSTIRRLASMRPTLRFACGEWLVIPLVKKCLVKEHNIDILDFEKEYDYGKFRIITFPLVHNVPNMGYKIHFTDGSRMIYATDTNNLNGIEAAGYDLYMIEANFDDDEIHERIKKKQETGQYAYEFQVLKNHLSRKKCDDFVYKNIGPNGVYVYMHEHRKSSQEG